MPKLNPDILVWARETAALSLADAARKIGLTDQRRLSDLEQGKKEPSFSLLLRMAKQYRRPLLTFYLEQPPQQGEYGVDFRTLPKKKSDPKTQALVKALIRNVVSRQQMTRATLEAEDEAKKVAFIGSLHTDGSIQGAVAKINKVLGLHVANYRREKTAEEAFRLLRSRLEEAGVFVLLKKNLGSHHTNISVEAFRGFALAEAMARFIVINPDDSVPARSFTLLHELTHLLLGETGISGAAVSSPQVNTEKFCNQVASAWLLPASDLDTLDLGENKKENIRKFARKHHLSCTMVSYRLWVTNKINRQVFNRLKDEFFKDWKQSKNARPSSGGPSYYVMHKSSCGPALCKLVRRMMDAKALSVTKAARILDIKPAHVYGILGDAR